MKTLKPGNISLYTAFLISVVVTAICMVLLWLFQVTAFLWISLALLPVVFLCSLLFIRYALNTYFYRNIHVIYKNILQLKGIPSTAMVKPVSDENVLVEVNKILIDWEKGNKEEIVHLKELETYRKEFLGNVSHELKTPIFTIQGYIHTLIDGGIEDQDINMLYLQKASKSIDRLISIVDDLESISRLEAGEMILELRTFDIRELIEDVIESLELRARELRIELRLSGDNEQKTYVYADKDRIRQVLVNLLVNSIKYGKKNGQTTVTLIDQQDEVGIMIQDNGIGIEKHHLGRLFERFYRVDKSRSREQGGTGLGLAIVKHIVEAHGQKIVVESTPGEGTTFTFTLRKSR